MSSEEYSESIFRFSPLLIRELIKGLSPNSAIFSTFSGEMLYHIVHERNILKSFLKFSHLLIMDSLRD